MKMLRAPGLSPFAPPFLRAGPLVIAHAANILLYLGPRHRLVPESEAERLHANQLQLSVTDLVAEVHETHHPIASGLYYEDQKPEARRRSEHFTRERIPRFLSYFERVLEGGPGPYVFGDDVSYDARATPSAAARTGIPTSRRRGTTNGRAGEAWPCFAPEYRRAGAVIPALPTPLPGTDGPTR